MEESFFDIRYMLSYLLGVLRRRWWLLAIPTVLGVLL